MPVSRKRDPSFDVTIPVTVGKRFVDELKTLVDGLPQSFRSTYLRDEIFSKYCDPTTTPADVRRLAAHEKWLQAEFRNAKTNDRIFHMLACELDLGWIDFPTLVTEIRKVISRVLGELVYPAIIQQGAHTNGASTRVRRSPAAALRKLTDGVHISTDAVKHWIAAFSGSLGISSLELAIQEDSMLFTVPKKSDIDRVACKEPEANMLLQRSVGNHIRRRLRVFGIDLNDQTRNQELARVAVERKLATIDLSSASDTISRELVRHLLPFDWFSLLDDLRVKATVMDGNVHELSMFSSMGNGFTFELESLIFYAITRAVCRLSRVRGSISVYGDDIIAPSAIVRRLSRVFSLLGFKVNPKKTHYRGPFRESCGAHFYAGFDVTPFYVRGEVRILPDLINHLNHLLKWNSHLGSKEDIDFQDEMVYDFWRQWIDYVPKRIWGGNDLDNNSALVTGHAPRKHLVAVTRQVANPEMGRYLHWHMVREHTDLPVSVDPRENVAWRIRVAAYRGERTALRPGTYWSSGLWAEGRPGHTG